MAEGDIQALLNRLHEIEVELEERLAERREEFAYRLEEKRVVFEAEVLAQHRRLKTGLIRFIRQSPVLSLITAPVVYMLIVPLVSLDAFVWLYQRVCFFVWNIPRVRRTDYVVMDRHNLAYLNGIQKLNCVYCGYANGVIAYAREVASRTEQFWCPIKHALRVKEPHRRYRDFLEFGDAEGFRQQLEILREEIRKLEPRQPSRQPGKSGPRS